MIVTRVLYPSEVGQPHYRLLMSDLHLGSPNADHAKITADLDAARSVGARILINGDVFDAIGQTDKRYDATALHPDVRGKKDLQAAIVDLAYGVLSPYADLIDVIGIGNHEEVWIRYNHGDPVRLLIDRLNAASQREPQQRIRHGGFTGYITSHFKVPGVRRRAVHKLYYLHGTGGDSPVTLGTIDFNRKARNFAFDALTFGHKHNLVVSASSVMDCTEGGLTFERLQLNLQTGSYYRNYSQNGQGDPLDYSYAESKGHPPKPMGGLFLVMRPVVGPGGHLLVRQSFQSEIVPPWKPAKKKAA